MSPKSQQQREAADKYLKEKVDTIAVRVPKGRKAEIKAHTDKRGESVNSFMIRAIDQTIERERPQEATGGPTATLAGLPPDTLKAAQRAAEATGEAIPQFVSRAVEEQVKRDKNSWLLGINPAKKVPDKKSGT